jgi:DNA helicase TIP49 (TBP-interacting protein)
MITAIEAGKSILVVGEAGSGKTTLAETLLGAIGSDYQIAFANYSGSTAATLKSIADQWHIEAFQSLIGLKINWNYHGKL